MRKIDISLLSKVAVGLSFMFLLTASPVFSQTDDKFDFSVTLNSDQFFGFYPYFGGSYSLSESSAFTFYGILWSGGTGGGWGNWTEFGIGMDFTVADGLSINPSVGILNGSLLSSTAAGPSVFGEGIVPNVVIGLDKEKVEGEIYAGYYAPLRDEAPTGGSTRAYLHYWANIGFKASSFFSLGVHYEQLDNSAGSNVPSSVTLYQWLGPYVQFADPNGKAFARFAGGGDLVEGNDSFFKITTGFNF